MSLARIAAHRGAYAVAVALNSDPRHGAEYVAALDRAWRTRRTAGREDRLWIEVRMRLPFELAEELYRLALARSLHDAARAIAAGIATTQYPEVR